MGTIDQALMAVMNVKHGFVRTFGLAGKVVILDEVHSYDAYTGTILDELVQSLRQLHCTVIILSATLTHQRRHELLKYAPTKTDYPLISTVSGNNDLQEINVNPLVEKTVKIQLHQSETQAIDDVLLRAEQGQQILWVENTVTQAQERYKLLAAKASEIKVDCGLLHSRFLKIDRDCNEEHWVKMYGTEGAANRQTQGRVLIGTQVLEQSLDIDADFLVTRLCPTDMLLQRLGRLWRHEENVRPVSAVREAWVLAPDFMTAVTNAEQAFGGTAYVYDAYVLCRTLEVWRNIESVSLPGQIRSLIEATYADRVETGTLGRYQETLLKSKEILQRFALVGLSRGGTTLPESSAQTRYNHQNTVDVLLLRSFRHKKDLSSTDVSFLNGDEIYLPHNIKAQTKTEWRNKAAKLMENTVRVVEHWLQMPSPAKVLLGWKIIYTSVIKIARNVCCVSRKCKKVVNW